MKILRLIQEPQVGDCEHCRDEKIIVMPAVVEIDEQELELDFCNECTEIYKNDCA